MGKEKSKKIIRKKPPNLVTLFSNFTKEEQSNIINNILHLGLKSLEEQTVRRSQQKNNNKVIDNDIFDNSSDNETITLESSSDTSSEDINSSNGLDLDNSLESELYSESHNSSKSTKSSSTKKSSICQTPINDSYTNKINENWTKYPFRQNISEYMAEYVEKKIDTNNFDNDIIPINLMPDENNSTPVVVNICIMHLS